MTRKSTKIRKRVALVLPDKPTGHYEGIMPHLGLSYLASALKRLKPAPEVRMVNFALTSREKGLVELADFNPDVVGISMTAFTAKKGLEFARFSHEELGARVILGGPHPHVFAEQILHQMPFVSAVCRGDGEEPIRKFVEDPKVKGVLTGSRIPLDEAEADFSLSDIDAHGNKFSKNFRRPGSRTVPTALARGCYYGANPKKKCIFCSIPDSRVRRREDFTKLWRDLVEACQKYGVNIFYDVCDSFSTLPRRYLENILRAKPSDFNASFWVYSSAADVCRNPSLMQLYKELGVEQINMGFESPDSQALKRLSKPSNNETNIRAAEIIDENGLRLYASFILGTPSETEQTLEATSEFALQIAGRHSTRAIDLSYLCPVPGSRSFEMLLDTDSGAQFAGQITPGYENLVKAWFNEFCKVPFSEAKRVLTETRRKIVEKGGITFSFD
ncbi:MAG: B12-binding domain-containing radical SAM protein [bacterium]|nr:B12-binding domain-containing radical SAM protein [bacterium]